jgi:hypothetical protein
MHLTRAQQLAVAVGVWVIAVISNGAEIAAATSPSTLVAVVVVGALLTLTST